MKIGRTILCAVLGIIIAGSAVGIVKMTRNSEGEVSWKTHEETETVVSTESVETETEKKEGKVIPPEIDEQLLTVNEWSRPGTRVKEVEYIVIHYLGNPRTTAQENRDYFESLKELQDEYMSANFVVGLEGEVIECIPDGEVAYASNNANDKSISIENCNIDESGKFIKDTYISLVKLTAYLADKYDLGRDGVIRHYDVTGKMCPLYYVENEDAWEAFLDDVELYTELCKSESEDLDNLEAVLTGLEYTYSSQYDGSIGMNDHLDHDEEDDETEVAGRPYEAEDDDVGYEEEESYDDSADYGADSYSYDDSYTSDSYTNDSYYDNSYSNSDYSADSYSNTDYSNNTGYYEYQEPVYDTGANTAQTQTEAPAAPAQTEAAILEDTTADDYSDDVIEIDVVEDGGAEEYVEEPIYDEDEPIAVDNELF